MDLKEFPILKNINAANNKFTNCDWLFNLSAENKEKLEKINFFGNEIKEIDFSKLLKEFPQLEINLENNPLSGDSLINLGKEQFSHLLRSIKERKVKINSWKGTLLVDLLENVEQLREKRFVNQILNAKLAVEGKQTMVAKLPDKDLTNNSSIGSFVILLGLLTVSATVLVSANFRRSNFRKKFRK